MILPSSASSAARVGALAAWKMGAAADAGILSSGVPDVAAGQGLP
jgi:hypothetical protein